MPISFVLVVLTITMIPNQVKSSPILLNVQQSGGLCSLDLAFNTEAIDEAGVAEYKYVINSTETDETEIAYAPVGNDEMTHSTKISCAEIQINSYGVDSERNDVTQASDTKTLTTGPFVDYTLIANGITQRTVSLRFTLNQGGADKYGVTLFEGCHNQFNHDDVFSESVNHFDFDFQCGDLIQNDTEYTISVVFFCPTEISDCQVKIDDVLTVKTLPEPATEATEPTTPEPKPTTPELEPTTLEPEPTTPEPEPTTPEPEPTTPEPEPTTPEPEPTTPEPEPTTPTPEPTTPTPEPTTPEPEPTTHEPEPTTPEPEPTTPEPEPTTPEPEPTTPEPEPTTPEPEPTTPEAEPTTPEPEPTTPEPEPTTPEPEATTPESDSTTSEPESTTTAPETEPPTPTPEPTTPEPEPTTQESESTTSESESTTTVPETEPPTPTPERTTPELEQATPEPVATTPEPEPKPKPTTATSPPESEKQEKTRRCTKHVFPLWAVCFASVQAATIVILSIVFAILFKLEYWKPESDGASIIERQMIDNERPCTSSSSGYWSNKRLDPVIVTNESETKNFTNRLVENRLKAGLPSTARPSTRPTSRSLSTQGSSSSILSDVNSTKTSALGGTRSTSNNSRIKITQDLQKPSDTVKKVDSPESEEIDETKEKNMRGFRMGLKSDTKTESYTRPNSLWNQVKISKHDPVKENYSGVRSRFMEGLHKKHAYYLSRKSQKPPVAQRRF